MLKRWLLNSSLSLALFFIFSINTFAVGEISDHSDNALTEVDPNLSSPRKTLGTFLQSMNDIKSGQPERIKNAVKTLDLSLINPLIRDEKGRDIAWLLLEAIDKTQVVNLNKIPDRKTGQDYIFSRYSNGSIEITRIDGANWKFSSSTVNALPNIIDELSSKNSLKKGETTSDYLPWQISFRQQLPESLRSRTFLLENWKWLGILLIIAVGVILDKLTAFVLQLSIKKSRARAKTTAFAETPDDLLRPFGMMAMAIVWWGGLNLLSLPDQAMIILLVAVKILAGFAGVWAAYRLVDLITQYLRFKAGLTDNKVDDVLVPLISKTLKVFVTVIGITFVASNLNLNVSSLLASLGLGGLAFALAAKDVVQNLFGSVTVILDQTFHVGDWIVVNDVEGSVEEIGLRSTKIRTFYDSLITLPNSAFITANVDNMGQRRYRRLKCQVSLTYDTPPDQIESFCEGVRELIRLHPYMRKDYFHVYLNELSASSLDILVYVFWETPDWSTELRERQRFLLDILRLANALGIELAFPTQTLHVRNYPEGASSETRDIKNISELTQQSKDTAKSIVTESTGLDKRPPPVTF